MLRIRTNLLGQSVIQEYTEGKWRKSDSPFPLCEVVILPAGEYELMQVRIAQAEKRAEKRAEAQRKSRAAKVVPPVAMESNPLEQA
jgi:hypothetical protein